MEPVIKPVCEYGADCYRKNPNHFKEYSHPRKEVTKPQPKPKEPDQKKPKFDKEEFKKHEAKKPDKKDLSKKFKQTTLDFGKKNSDHERRPQLEFLKADNKTEKDSDKKEPKFRASPRKTTDDKNNERNFAAKERMATTSPRHNDQRNRKHDSGLNIKETKPRILPGKAETNLDVKESKVKTSPRKNSNVEEDSRKEGKKFERNIKSPVIFENRKRESTHQHVQSPKRTKTDILGKESDSKAKQRTRNEEKQKTENRNEPGKGIIYESESEDEEEKMETAAPAAAKEPEQEEEEEEKETKPQTSSWTYIKKPTEPKDTKPKKDPKNSEDIIKELFLFNAPPDFYEFFEFCKNVNEKQPLKALEKCGLTLVGPYDALTENVLPLCDAENVVCHWRYYFDPPEFQTVLSGEKGFHMGYWRDDPRDLPVFVASNDSNKDCTFKIEAANIFGAVNSYLLDYVKTCDPFVKIKISKLQNQLSQWAESKEISLEKMSEAAKKRQKKVVSKTIHRAGIVVPVEPKTEVGYRPLIETEANLKKICKLIMESKDSSERESLWENLQPLITAANIANDECDFGNSLELGIDLFCMGSSLFHDTIEHLLCTAYSLLNRNDFAEIIKKHLKNRRKCANLSIL